MKSLVHTEELSSRSVTLEHAPGAKSLVCIGLKNALSAKKVYCFVHQHGRLVTGLLRTRGQRRGVVTELEQRCF